jgi:hypothetical protein
VWQRKPENRAPRAFDPAYTELAFVGLDDHFANGQAEAITTFLLTVWVLFKGGENFAFKLGAYTRALVANFDESGVRFICQADRDLAVFG